MSSRRSPTSFLIWFQTLRQCNTVRTGKTYCRERFSFPNAHADAAGNGEHSIARSSLPKVEMETCRMGNTFLQRMTIERKASRMENVYSSLRKCFSSFFSSTRRGLISPTFEVVFVQMIASLLLLSQFHSTIIICGLPNGKFLLYQA